MVIGFSGGVGKAIQVTLGGFGVFVPEAFANILGGSAGALQDGSKGVPSRVGGQLDLKTQLSDLIHTIYILTRLKIEKNARRSEGNAS